MDKKVTYKIILFITLIFVLFIVYDIIEVINDVRTKEGFDVKKVAKDIGNGIMRPIKSGIEKSIGSVGKTVITALGTIGKALGSITTIGKAIANVGIQMANFFKKIAMMFPKLFTMIWTNIIEPLLGFFIGIGNVFIQLISILMKIVTKITDLPKCMPVFIASGIMGGIDGFYKAVVPGFIRDILSLIWQFAVIYPLWIMYYTLMIPLDFIVKIIFKFSIEKKINDFFKSDCNNFNVDKEVASMARGFTSAASNFMDKFGKMDFKSLL